MRGAARADGAGAVDDEHAAFAAIAGGGAGALAIARVARAHRAREIDDDAATHAARVVRSEGFEARCLQHELDHLDGLLFLDRVDSLTTDVFRRSRRG